MFSRFKCVNFLFNFLCKSGAVKQNKQKVFPVTKIFQKQKTPFIFLVVI